MRKITLFLVVQLLMFTLVFSRVRTVTGKITDEKGIPVAGATVMVKSTTRRVATVSDGTFTSPISNSAKALVISSVNFNDKEVSIGNQTNLTIPLTSVQAELSVIKVK